jgi:hypothetical protein
VIALLKEDGDRIVGISRSPLGHLQGLSAANKRGCSSALRSGDLPWHCDDGQVRSAYADVERYLGLAAGRLETYQRALPTGVAHHVDSTGEVVRFYLSDPDAPPCHGTSDLLYATNQSFAASYDAGPRTVATHLVDLGGGFFADACSEITDP